MEMLDVTKLAEKLQVPRSQIYRLAGQGKLKAAYKVGKYWRFPWPEILGDFVIASRENVSVLGQE